MLTAGDKAPRFALPDASTGEIVHDPWAAGPIVIAFFKTTCPVCQMVAPKLSAIVEAGAPVIGVGQDPPERLRTYATTHGQRIPTVSEAPPYDLSCSFGISVVPTLFRVGSDGVIHDTVVSWDRDRWNSLAESLEIHPLSDESDGLPTFRPG